MYTTHMWHQEYMYIHVIEREGEYSTFVYACSTTLWKVHDLYNNIHNIIISRRWGLEELCDHIVIKDGWCSNHTITDPFCAAFDHIVYQVVLLILTALELRKVIFHCQKFSKLWDLGPLQKVAKESGGLKEELDFILCNNITRSANHKNHCICIVSIEHISQALPFFLYSTIHMINMIVAFCITLWSSTYFSPFSQLKYFSQCCATSGMPLFSIYCWWNKQIFKYTQYTCTCYMYM